MFFERVGFNFYKNRVDNNYILFQFDLKNFIYFPEYYLKSWNLSDNMNHLKLLKERKFFKVLKACDVIVECMDEKSGVITDLDSMKEKLDNILK